MEMLQYACSLNQKQKVNFLDPGFGTGVFYSACLNVFSAERIQKAVGYEIDQAYWKAAIDLWNKETRLQLINADFTKTTIPNLEKDRFDLLICNPPYIRHHAMTSNDKKRLVDLVDSTIGIRPSGYSGMYCYFLLLSHYWMSKDGIAGWLIPSEFMDVNYGKQVKQYLLNKVTLLRIHRFNPSEVQFDDALVSSAIVWLKNSLPAPNHTVEFSYGGTFLKPSISKLIPVEILRNSPKWSGFTTNSYEINENKINKTLGDFFTIKRGIATGANEFFCFNSRKS